MNLEEFFKENNKIALGFSGGTDSAYLLYEGKRCGADVQPYYIKTEFQPRFEYEDAKRLCSELGVTLKVVEFSVLSNEDIAKNPPNRCYYCKKAIFSALADNAVKDGYSVIIDGTNASDKSADRPGMRAIAELNVRSPLRECKLTKNVVRHLSKQAGLFTWDKPSYACLATRILTGKRIDKAALEKIEQSEDVLREMGFSDFRVRVFSSLAVLQVTENQLDKAVNERTSIVKSLTPYFDKVVIDMETR